MFFSLSYIRRSFPYSIQQSKWYACQKKLLVHTKSTMLIELLSEGSLVCMYLDFILDPKENTLL